VNIYEFSVLEQEQALLLASPISAYIQLENCQSELEKFIVDSQRTLIPRKRFGRKVAEFSSRLKAFPLKLNRFPSKVKKLISKDLAYKVIVIVIGTIILITVANGVTMIFSPTQNLHNYNSVDQIERVEPSVVPRVAPDIKETSPKLIMSEMKNLKKDSIKDSLNTPSRLKSGKRVRKKAKLVRFSDLSPLPDQDFDWDIDSTPIQTSSAIKIKIR
jgi:hypothetical protein